MTSLNLAADTDRHAPTLLTAPDTFLHAYERLGVIEEPLTPTWARKIAFAFLFPAR